MRFHTLAPHTMLTLTLLLGALPRSPAQTGAVPEQRQTAEAAPAATPDDTLTIPFTSYPFSRSMIVQAQVNGSQPLPFVLDTGFSEPLVIEARTAKALGITPTKKTITVFPGGHTFFWAADSDLRVRGDKQRNLDFSGVPPLIGDLGLYDLGPSHPVGFIGVPIVSSLALQIDFAAHTVTLFAHAPPAPGRDSLRLPIIQPDKSSARYYVLCPIAVPGPDAIRTNRPVPVYRLLLDTGSSGSMLLAAPRLRPTAAFSGAATTLAGTSLKTSFLLPQITLGAYPLKNVVLATGLPLSRKITQKDNVQGLLGMDILSRFRVTLDFPNKQLVLEPREAGRNSGAIFGETGLRLGRRGEACLVSRVFAASPAAEAGVRVGDEVVSADGFPLTGVLEHLAQSTLDGQAATDVRVVLMSASGTLRTVTLQRESGTDPRFYLKSGVQLRQARPGGAVDVEALFCGGAAWAAGLRPGDQLQSIDGTRVQTREGAEVLLGRWPTRTVAVTVRRGKGKQVVRLRPPAIPVPAINPH